MSTLLDEDKWVLMTELNGEPLLHHFRISNSGKVFKIKKGEGTEIVFDPKEIGGYKYISFTTRNGSRETIYLHRLIADFFIKPSSPAHQFVIHKDYDRKNNHADNLQWVPKDVLYKHRSAKAGRIPGKNNSRKKLLKPEGIADESVALKTDGHRKLIAQTLGIMH